MRANFIWSVIVCMLLPLLSIAQPIANFSSNVTTACSPIVAQFTDLSTGNPTSWQWNLGNGVTSNLQNPSTTYITAGTYTVTLTVSNANGSDTKTVTNYITVKASPVVNFTGDSTVSCPPKSIAFTNLTVPNAAGTTTYLWDFGDGYSSSSGSPVHLYTSAGNFNVTLVATNSLGCSKTLTKSGYIPLVSRPVASFSSVNNNNCVVPTTVNFQNTSTNAVSYQWNFGDGNTSTAASPSHQYNSSGSYTVRLIATNAAGCSDTFTQNAFVNLGAVNAAFSVNSSNTCINKTVSFTNTTTPVAGSATWYFGDGTSTTGINVTHNYATAGNYNVIMVVQFGSCTDTASQTITVNAKPSSQFTANYTTACSLPFTTQFSNTSTGATSYLWIFGDGSTSTVANPQKTYTTAGLYTVKLVSYNASGCTDTFTRQNYIHTLGLDTSLFHVVVEKYYSHCAPTNVQFFTYNTVQVPAIGYQWSFGNTYPPTCSTCGPGNMHYYPNPGTYTVTVTVQFGNGCNVTKHLNFTLGTKPTAAFTVSPDSICPNQVVTFTNNTTNGTSYRWAFGDGDTSTLTSPTHIYGISGSYPVTLVATNSFCSDSITVPNSVYVHPPTANFGSKYDCINRKLFHFYDSSIGANTYYWNFGDGNTSTQTGPVVNHTYTNYGTYLVTQAVTNTTSGCTDTFHRIVYSYPLNVGFTSSDTNICRKESVSFAAVTDSNYVGYTWALGDGGTSTIASPVYQYNNTGVYNVKLVVTDLQGCKDSLIKTNHVHVGGPVANFSGTPLTGCTPLNVTFTDNSAMGGVSTNNRIWTFGDGQQSTGPGTNMAHVYNTAGNYSVKLKVTDVNGCADSITKSNYVKPTKPTAGFFTNDTAVCSAGQVNFTNLSGGSGINVIWYFGDGTTSTTYAPAHVYANPGYYTVKLVVTDNNGCKDSVTKTNYIHVLSLNITFNASDTVGPCPPLAVNFTNTTPGLTNLAWNLGNGNLSSLSNPSTVYTYPGVYTVKLVGENTLGCTDSASRTITVNGPTGTLTYTPVSGCNPLTVNFSSVSSNTQSYIWDMNNGVTQTTTGPSFSYSYIQSGKYLPKLVLSDGMSCLVPIQGVDTIIVDEVSADFSFSPLTLCDTGTIQFTDTLYFSQSTVTRTWLFGDGGSGSGHNPVHFYAAPGTYQVKMIVHNATGCSDTIIKTVNVYASPNVSAGNNQAVCAGNSTPVQLQATGASTYTWSPATGLSCTACANPSAIPASTVTYTVTGTDTHGCTDTGNVIITVNPLPNVSAGTDKIICAGTSTTLQATGGTSYTWSPTTGLSCSNCAAPTANPVTTTSYTVTGTDANGCTDTGNVTVTVNATPTISTGPNKTICSGTSATLQATGGISYTWSPATGLSCTACANPTASPTTTTTYMVTGMDANGCSNTATVTVTVNPLPTISAGANVAICAGASTTLQATGGTSYTWSPATGLSCTTCAAPTANPTATTTYTVTGTDANSCSNTATVTLTVNPLPTISAGANVAICAGASTTLQATGGTSYTWSPATGLSCTTCATPTANPTTTTTYTVTGTNANGCSNTATVTVTVNPLPTISAGTSVAICAGASTTLQATGGTSYTWSPATGLSCTTCAAPTANPATTTTYTVTGTDTNSCSNTATVTVTVNPLPTISAGTNVAICAGASTTLQATGGSSYTWSPATALSCTTCASPTASPTATTTYTVTGTNTNSCSNTATVTVTVNPLPTISAGTNKSICIGSATTLPATGGASYTWTPATGLSCTSCATPTANPTTTTTYTVTGTNANGCVNTANVTVTVNPLPVISAGSNKTICAGSSTALQATGGTFYAWAPTTGLSCTGCQNPTATPATTTTYVVTGTNTNGCSDTAHVTVTVNPLPTISGGGNKAICTGASVQLQGSGGTSYTWSPAAGLSCTACAAPTASPISTTTYTVTGTDANGCISTATVAVTVNAIPNVTATTSKNIICDGTSAQLQAFGAGSYSWTPALNLSCVSCNNPVASPPNDVTYIVTGTTNGCSDTAQVHIKVLPKPNINAGPDTSICAGDSVRLHGSGNIPLTWSPGTSLSCSNCNNPVATPAATTTYTLSATDSNSCANTDDVTITVHPLPNVDAGDDATICNGDPLQLSAKGADTYSWSPATDLSCVHCKNPVATPTGQITYTVTGTDGFGCSNSDEIQVSVIQKEPTSASPDADICRNGSVTLNASGGDTYQWIPSSGLDNPNIPNPKASPENTTTYAVIIKQGICFADTSRVKVTVHENPTINAGPDQNTISGTPVQLRALGSNVTRYEWSPANSLDCSDCSSPKATPFVTTTYEVRVYTALGCTSKDEVTVHVSCDKTQLFIPNTFTPNGDGVNDRFFPQGKGITSVQSFRVFNRWGQIVFDAQNIPLNDETHGWDGTYKNEPLSPDVFIYIINAFCESGEPLELKGDISLVR